VSPSPRISTSPTDGVLSQSPTPPFTPDEHETISEEKRLAYRYLDLRRHEMQETLRTRAR